jgi:predicted kinase
MHPILLVNGVPASGKSTVAAAIARRLRLPILAVDTVKEAFFDHLGIGDRDYSRKLGRASYQAIFATIAAFPDGLGAIVDAWHKFVPLDLLEGHLIRAEAAPVIEIWCHSPPEICAERYRARADQRHPGHPPASYAQELADLAARATPIDRWPVIDVDTNRPLDEEGLIRKLNELLCEEPNRYAQS